jgi:hypothetical protein
LGLRGGDVTFYLHPTNGDDAGSGGQGSPLRTLAEAARRVNASEGAGAVTVVLAERCSGRVRSRPALGGLHHAHERVA